MRGDYLRPQAHLAAQHRKKTTYVTRKDSGEFAWFEGLALCVAAVATQLSSEIMNQWGVYFYSPSEGVGRTLYVTINRVWLIFLIGTLWDAVTDPVIGIWSDRTTTRPRLMRFLRPSGRRRPFIFWGSIFMTFSAVAFWYPPVEGVHVANLIYGSFMLCLHWLLFTITVVPLLALAPEIARSEQARVRLGTWTAIGMVLGLALANALPGKLIVKLDPARTEENLVVRISREGGRALDLETMDRVRSALIPAELKDQVAVVHRGKNGLATGKGVGYGRVVEESTGDSALLTFSGDVVNAIDLAHVRDAILAALPDAGFETVRTKGSFSPVGYRRLALAMAILSTVLFQFPVWCIRERYNSDAASQNLPAPMTAGLGDALRNRPFIAYSVAFFLFTVGFLGVQRALPYWAELGLGGDEGTVTWLMIPFIVTALASYAVIPSLTKRFHVKWMVFTAFLIVTSGLPWMYVIPHVPVSSTTKIVLGGILFAYCGLGQGIMYVLMPPMVGECIDYDEMRSGQRREALYNGLSGFVLKSSVAGSIALASGSMSFWGNSPGQPLGVLLVGPVAALFGLCGMAGLLFYPVLHVTREQVAAPATSTTPKSASHVL